MFDTIEEYLDALKKEMKGGDPALIKDALSDAREHPLLALDAARERSPDQLASKTYRWLARELALLVLHHHPIQNNPSPSSKRKTPTTRTMIAPS